MLLVTFILYERLQVALNIFMTRFCTVAQKLFVKSDYCRPFMCCWYVMYIVILNIL